MPELPEVEITRRGLEGALLNRSLARVWIRRGDLRQPVPEDLPAILQGRRLVQTIRRGKYILGLMDDDSAFVLHLGMSGRIGIQKKNALAPGLHDHVIFETTDGACAVFHDPRRFGLLYLTCRNDWHSKPPFSLMGPEPLEETFTGAVLKQGLSNRKAPIKTVLLDQSVVAGIGNIYACEALFEAGINPLRAACSIDSYDAEKLVKSIKEVLGKALAAGGSTLRDYRHADGLPGYFQHSFSVYDQEGQACPGCLCGAPGSSEGILRVVQSARSTFYCARKQR